MSVELLVVSGLSGAGKTTALRALEDLQYFCVDNLPVAMLPQLVEVLSNVSHRQRIAAGVDARDPTQLASFGRVHAQLLEAGHRVQVLFLEAPVDVLIRRFSETRRRHPLGELPDAIEREIQAVGVVRDLATVTIDTGKLNPRALRASVRDRYAERAGLSMILTSFGFKRGIPAEADLMFDVRFLANPYDDLELRPQTGRDPAVAQYVLSQPDTHELLERIEGWMRFQLPRAMAEGRGSLTFAIGCTGGQHRSVAVVEALGQRFSEQPETSVSSMIVRHRDMELAQREY